MDETKFKIMSIEYNFQKQLKIINDINNRLNIIEDEYRELKEWVNAHEKEKYRS